MHHHAFIFSYRFNKKLLDFFWNPAFEIPKIRGIHIEVVISMVYYEHNLSALKKPYASRRLTSNSNQRILNVRCRLFADSTHALCNTRKRCVFC